jgi:hypothetical protein
VRLHEVEREKVLKRSEAEREMAEAEQTRSETYLVTIFLLQELYFEKKWHTHYCNIDRNNNGSLYNVYKINFMRSQLQNSAEMINHADLRSRDYEECTVHRIAIQKKN